MPHGRRLVAILIAAALLFVLACRSGPSQLIEIAVNSPADGTDANPGNRKCETVPGNGVCSLRAAIMEANALPGFNRILIPIGVYTLSITGRGENNATTGDLDVTGDLELNAVGGGLVVVIGTRIDRVLEIRGSINVTINGLAFEEGDSMGDAGGGIRVGGSSNVTLLNAQVNRNLATAGFGGGIYNEGTLVLINSSVFSNSGHLGGGISNDGLLTLTNSIVDRNTATLDGGGISSGFTGRLELIGSRSTDNVAGQFGGGINSNGPILLRSSSVDSNRARIGGGIASGGILELANSVVERNRSDQIGGAGGGGIYQVGGALTADNTTIRGNVAIGNGGGIAFQSGATTATTATIMRSTINNNAATDGGGIYISASGTLVLTNSTISNNTATTYGGGIAILTPDVVLTVSSATIVENTAGNTAGGIANADVHIIATSSLRSAAVTLKNTILANNTGGECSSTGRFVTDGYNLIGRNLSPSDPCNFTGQGDITNRDPLLDRLADNGGPTQTHALHSGSPAIDAVATSACPPPGTDQRGVRRPQGPSFPIRGPACDIGAFER